MENNLLQLKRKVIGRLVFTFFFLSLSFRFLIHATPSQFLEPVLFQLNFYFTYWLFKLSGLSYAIIENRIGSILFDFLILTSGFLCILFPSKKMICILFGCLFFVYAIAYNTYIVHHAHPLAIMTLISIPFYFRNTQIWNFLWESIRCYVCYLYTISFIWKLFVGKSLLFWNMGVNSVKLNLVEYIYDFPNANLTILYNYLIANPVILNSGTIFIFLLEGFMMIGFFTKKFDYILLFIPIIIHTATYFFADVFFMDMLIGVFTFLSTNQILKIKSAFPFIAK